MDIELSRYNMIEQQIRPWDVLDQQVLNLLGQVKREDFVPEAYQSLAFADIEIPLGHDDAMWSPKLEARVLQALDIKPHERTLEIGAGSGYLTALIAAQAMHVVSIEIDPELAASAAAKLKAHGIENATIRTGDGAQDWTADGSFDVIVLTGSTPRLPDAYLSRLNKGGRLFAILGDGPAMQATLFTRAENGEFRSNVIFETCLKPLTNAPETPRFVF